MPQPQSVAGKFNFWFCLSIPLLVSSNFACHNHKESLVILSFGLSLSVLLSSACMPRPQGVWLLAPLLLLTLFCRIINWQKLEVGKCEKVAWSNYSTDQQLPRREEEEEQILYEGNTWDFSSDNCRRFFTAHLSMQSKQDWGNWQLFRITVCANQWAAGCVYCTIYLNSLFSLTKSLSCQTCSSMSTFDQNHSI